MKNERLTKEELRRIEYEFGENKNQLPQDFVQIMESGFNLMRPYIEIEQPMTDELSATLGQLIVQQYPLFRAVNGNWWTRWIREIARGAAQQLAVNLILLFDDLKNGVNRTKLYNDFEEAVAFYTLPHEAHRRAMPNFEGTPFWEEVKEEVQQEIESDFEEEKIACEIYNKQKTEFIQTVQPIVFKYLGAQTEMFDTTMWQLYGITLGSVYYRYEEDCSDFAYMLELDKLTNDPGLDFYAYKLQFSQECLPSIPQ